MRRHPGKRPSGVLDRDDTYPLGRDRDADDSLSVRSPSVLDAEPGHVHGYAGQGRKRLRAVASTIDVVRALSAAGWAASVWQVERGGGAQTGG